MPPHLIYDVSCHPICDVTSHAPLCHQEQVQQAHLRQGDDDEIRFADDDEDDVRVSESGRPSDQVRQQGHYTSVVSCVSDTTDSTVLCLV